ncbi:PIN domain-containing protein [Candidatus Halobeggiatoa sp. HSG11]|nr:PIN domain-containing protein [Candidatus Halobeggiatoa sp. HSG11]
MIDEKDKTCLIDSNILLYAFIETKDIHKLVVLQYVVLNLLRYLRLKMFFGVITTFWRTTHKLNVVKSVIQNKNIEITISTQVINEVCVNLIKKVSFSEEKIRKMVVSFYNKYNIIEINKEIIIKASEIRERYNFSFWDSLIFASALYANVEILYSEDMQDGFIIDKTRIVNPFKQCSSA